MMRELTAVSSVGGWICERESESLVRRKWLSEQVNGMTLGDCCMMDVCVHACMHVWMYCGADEGLGESESN